MELVRYCSSVMANNLSKLYFPFCLSGCPQCQTLCAWWSRMSSVGYRGLTETAVFSISQYCCVIASYLSYCCLPFNLLDSPLQCQFIASLFAGGVYMFCKLKSRQEQNNHFLPIVIWQSYLALSVDNKFLSRWDTNPITVIWVNHLILCTRIFASKTVNSSSYKPLTMWTGRGIPRVCVAE